MTAEERTPPSSDAATSLTQTGETRISAEHKAEALGRVNRERPRIVSWAWEWARSLAAALLLFFVMHIFVVEAFKIPSGSMEETLLVGDFLLVNKAVYGAPLPFGPGRSPAVRAPLRGDVVVFRWPPDPEKNFVKRLLGLPGDTLSMIHGTLVRNGVRISEGYVQRTEPGIDPAGEDFRWQRGHLVPTAEASSSYHPSRNNWGPIVVPDHHFFVLGDNRDNSLDSRYWGFVPDSLLRGTPLVVYYSYQPDSASRLDWLTRIRWSRLGERIH
ncbi:MAG: signal peptidase I [Gemmatimonadota bacterium]